VVHKASPPITQVGARRHRRNKEVIVAFVENGIPAPGEVSIVRAFARAIEIWRGAISRLAVGSMRHERHLFAIISVPGRIANTSVALQLPVEAAAHIPKTEVAADGRRL
jgi:hypothetical protein